MTPKQRNRKIETAAASLSAALANIDAVIDDLKSIPVRSAAEQEMWATLARIAGRVEDARSDLSSMA